MKNYTELIKEIANKTSISQKDAKEIIATFVDTITDTLVSGEDVKVNGIGTFKVKETAQRNGRNPLTGETLVIPASKKVTLTITKSLKDAVKNA